MTGTVAPGGTFKFSFNFHAPAKPGTYDEFFGVVEEGVAWFSDPGQGGPPDNQIEAQISGDRVPSTHGDVRRRSRFPAADQRRSRSTSGRRVEGCIDLKNVGTATWKAGETKLAPTPRDQASPLARPTWLVADAGLDARGRRAAGPGRALRLIPLRRRRPGDYTQTFALVDEGVTWFADAAKGGGPADDFLKLHVVFTDTQTSPPDGGAVADMSDGDGGDGSGAGTGGNGDDGNGDDGNGDDGNPPAGAHKGCAMAGSGDAGALWPLSLGIALLLVRRARRRRAARA